MWFGPELFRKGVNSGLYMLVVIVSLMTEAFPAKVIIHGLSMEVWDRQEPSCAKA